MYYFGNSCTICLTSLMEKHRIYYVIVIIVIITVILYYNRYVFVMNLQVKLILTNDVTEESCNRVRSIHKDMDWT